MFRAWDKDENCYIDRNSICIDGNGSLFKRDFTQLVPTSKDRYTIEGKAGETYAGDPVFDGDQLKVNGYTYHVAYNHKLARMECVRIGGAAYPAGTFLARNKGIQITGTIHDVITDSEGG